MRSTALTIASNNGSAVSTRHRIDEGQAQSVAVRVFSFHPSLEQMRQHLGIESRPIVLQDERSCIVFGSQPQVDRPGAWHVLQLIVEEICNHSMEQRRIGLNSERAAAVQFDSKTLFRQGWLVEIDHASQQFVQVNRNAVTQIEQAEPIVSAIEELDRLTDFLNKSLDVAEAKADALRLNRVGYGAWLATRQAQTAWSGNRPRLAPDPALCRRHFAAPTESARVREAPFDAA
jgi:hypothetical protein